MKAVTAIIGVKLKPGASREKILLVGEREVCISVIAPPVDGKANKALVNFLAKALDVPKSAIDIKRGHTSRIELVEIMGMTREDAIKKINEVETRQCLVSTKKPK